MNLSGVFGTVDLTTRAAVNAHRRGASTGVSEANAIVDSIITRESARITQYLARHTLKEARTEVYVLRTGRRVMRVDGYPIDFSVDSTTIPAITVANTLTALNLGTAADTDDADPFVDFGMGLVRFEEGVPYPRYVQIAYTGGMLTAYGDQESDLPGWLFHAATMQCVYAVQRGSSLGGNVETVAGVGATIEKEYGLLKTVREELDAHRRGE